VGGSLSHADPTAEIAAVVLAMNGTITVLGPAGARTIAAEDFFITYLTTALAEDEVVTEVRLPTAADSAWAFHEVVRRYSDFATVSVSVVAPPGAPDRVRVVLGGVADRPVLVASDLLGPALQAPGDPDAARTAAAGIAASVSPDTDLHGSTDHKRHLVAVHTRRLLEQVLADAGRNA
jgi:carbon-monoxide dehydrogenase medium subunit